MGASTQPRQPKIQNSGAASTKPATINNLAERKEISGVRCIWGTMKSCTSRTVLTTLQKLSSVSEKVQVRRKLKKRGEGAKLYQQNCADYTTEVVFGL